MSNVVIKLLLLGFTAHFAGALQRQQAKKCRKAAFKFSEVFILFNVLHIILYLGICLLATKLLGLLMGKIGLPQVVGMVLAGLIVGPAIFSNLGMGFSGIINPTLEEKEVMQTFSQIGVILILFSSGLETDFKELKKSGAAATFIAMLGVLVPMALGTLGASFFMGGISSLADHDKLFNALFVGAILAATSVGITVETLKELGKLNTRVGTAILSAAIIDDVIGIIALSVVTGLDGQGNILITLLKAVGFFAFTVVIGITMRFVFKWIEKKYPHKRRTGIFSLVMCFIFAYCAEEYFGIAAITGAYMAGLMLSSMPDTTFVDRKIVVSGYMFFTPIFFAFIGINADFSHFHIEDLWFGIVFVTIGILGKIIGCSAAAKAFRYNNHDSLAIGCGMVARGEVALAIYSAGKSLIAQSGGIDPLVGTIMLIVLSSILCPILLKLVFKNSKSEKPVKQVSGVSDNAD